MDVNKKEIKKWIILILIAIISYWSINNLSALGSVIGRIFDIIFPFVLRGMFSFYFKHSNDIL